MVHAVSATFERFEHMSPPAAGMALILHVLVAAFLIWTPTHHPDEPDNPIEVTMEAPPPPEPKPEPKPEIEKPKPPPPPAAAAPVLDRLGLPPAGPVGPKSTAPPMERGLPTYEPPAQKAEPPVPKQEPAAQPPPPQQQQQATAQPAEPPPPPAPAPKPTLEKELPPVEAPPAPVTSRDIPRITPPVPERKPEPPPQRPVPPRPAAPPSPQLQPSPLSRLPRNAPSQRQTEQPRSTFVNPADTYAQNTILEAYLQRVVYQVSQYRFDGTGLSPTDSVVARFTIARNGGLLAVSIVRSSGKPSLDRDAVTAFQQTGPFPPLPAEVPGDSRTFTLTFYPGRR